MNNEELINKRIDNYSNNLGLTIKGNLPFAKEFILSAINFLRKGQILSEDEEYKLKNQKRQLEKNDEKLEAVKVSAIITENKFLVKLFGRNTRRDNGRY